jgi:hypothetical protein
MDVTEQVVAQVAGGELGSFEQQDELLYYLTKKELRKPSFFR